MNYEFIEEVIDSLLPHDKITVVYKDLPPKGDVLLIEESQATGQIEILEGYQGLIESNIQFYVRKRALAGSNVAVRLILEDFYKLVYDKVGQTIGNYYIDNVGMFEISSSMRDKDDNIIQSLDFSIKYKRI